MSGIRQKKRVKRHSVIAHLQSFSRVLLFETSMDCSTPGFPVLHHLLEFAHSCPLSQWFHLTHLILCSPFLLLPSIFPSIRIFSNELALCIRQPKYWSFSFNISPSHEYSVLISFRMDWLDLLTAQGTLKSLLQHYSSKASILQCSAFFMVNCEALIPTPQLAQILPLA